MKNLNEKEIHLVSGGVYVAPSTNNPDAWFIDLGTDSEFRFSPNRKDAYVFNKTGVFFCSNDSMTAITADNMAGFNIKSLDYVGSPFNTMCTGMFVVEFM